jgi:predicted nuclease with TOPRIM domain
LRASNCSASEAELTNHREDGNAYQERYAAIQEEGRKLYELYEVKCIRIKELTKKVGALKEMCETLEVENTTLRDKCEQYAAAYEQAHVRAEELETDLESARTEAAEAALQVCVARMRSPSIIHQSTKSK